MPTVLPWFDSNTSVLLRYLGFAAISRFGSNTSVWQQYLRLAAIPSFGSNTSTFDHSLVVLKELSKTFSDKRFILLFIDQRFQFFNFFSHAQNELVSLSG